MNTLFRKLVREWTGGFFEAGAILFSRTGVSPNLLTVIGFLLMVGVAYVLSRGYLQLGGVLIVLAGLFDGFDGALARTMGRRSRFGAFLDSTLDRFSEAAIYLGLLVHYTYLGGQQEILLIYATIVGSLMVSYARARAEGIGVRCDVGLFTRLERVGLLVIGLVLNVMPIALWMLAILANFTAVQRVFYVWQVTGGERGG